MNFSDFDTELANCLKPLVDIGVIMQVAPYHNLLCVGYHYYVAHLMFAASDKGIKEALTERITIGEWQPGSSTTTVGTLLNRNKPFLFYGDANTGKTAREARLGNTGICGSVAVTKFKQCYIFVRNKNSKEVKVTKSDSKDIVPFFADLVSRFPSTTIHTDIEDCAGSLIYRLFDRDALTKNNIEIAHRARWPLPREAADTDLEIYIYSSPSTAYMLGASDDFIPVEVDARLHDGLAPYETHLIWFTPMELSSEHPTIRDTIKSYHKLLFDWALKSKDENNFAHMAKACTDILAERHPSSSTRDVGSPSGYARCLARHHSAPPP